MNILIQNSQVYNGKNLEQKDILVQEGIIQKIEENLHVSSPDLVINGENCIVSPGFCDLHVHLREPGFTEKETIATGTQAGAAGGFTTLCSMPNLNPVPDDLQHLNVQLKAIESGAKIQVIPYGSISVGSQGQCLSDIKVLYPFVAGFTDDGKGVQKWDIMEKCMKEIALVGGMAAAHCEIESLIAAGALCIQENSKLAREKGWQGIGNESEWKEVERDIQLAEKTGCHLHICHASTKETFALVREAKERGVHVTCEVTPHNLLLHCDDIQEDDARFKMNPPLRNREDMLAAQQALIDGTVDAIATDHAPHTATEKGGGFQNSLNGVVGLETCFATLYTRLVKPGKISLEALLHKMTYRPREILAIKQQEIRVGNKANFTILSTNQTKKVDPQKFLSKGKASPFTGWALQGWPQFTMYAGEVVFQNLEKSE